MVNNESLRLQFASRLNEAMGDAGYPERGRAVAVASQLKVSTVAAGKWIKGDSLPTPANMLVLCGWLGVRREWLEYGEGPKRAVEGAPVANGATRPPIDHGSPTAARLIRRILALDAQGAISEDAVRAIELTLKLASQAVGQATAEAPAQKSAGVLHKHTAEEVFKAQALQDNKEVIAEQTSGHIKAIRGSKKRPHDVAHIDRNKTTNK